MSAAADGNIFPEQRHWRLRVRAGQVAVVAGELLAVNQAIGGISGATEAELVTPLVLVNQLTGPMVIALESGSAGQYITVCARGVCMAKVANVDGGTYPIHPYAPLFFLDGDVANRRLSSTTPGTLRAWGKTLAVCNSANALTRIIFIGDSLS